MGYVFQIHRKSMRLYKRCMFSQPTHKQTNLLREINTPIYTLLSAKRQNHTYQIFIRRSRLSIIQIVKSSEQNWKRIRRISLVPRLLALQMWGRTCLSVDFITCHVLLDAHMHIYLLLVWHAFCHGVSMQVTKTHIERRRHIQQFTPCAWWRVRYAGCKHSCFSYNFR